MFNWFKNWRKTREEKQKQEFRKKVEVQKEKFRKWQPEMLVKHGPTFIAILGSKVHFEALMEVILENDEAAQRTER